MMQYCLFLHDSGIELVDVRKTCSQHLVSTSLSWDSQTIQSALGTLGAPATLALVLDFSDESVDYEWMPKLFPWEQPALEKRLKNRFDKNAFVHVHWLPVFQKNAEGREEQLILLASAPLSAKLDMVLKQVEALGLVLQQVYSYTFLMEAWFLKRVARRIGLKGKPLKQPFILTVRETQQRFRQYVFIKARLRMNRNIELGDLVTGVDTLSALLTETRATLRYLYNQRLVPHDHEVGQVYLNAYAQDFSNVIEGLRANLVSNRWELSRVVFTGESLIDLKLSASAPGEKRALMCLVQFLKTTSLVSFYHNIYTKRMGRLWRWSRLLWLAWLMVILLGSYVILQMTIDYFVLLDKSEQVVAKHHQFEKNKQRLQKMIHLQYDAEDMKATVDFFDQLKEVKQHASVGQELSFLSHVITLHPAIEMSEIRWKRLSLLDSEWLQVWLSGYVKGSERYEVLLQKVDAFMASLKKHPKVDNLEYVNEPLNRNADQALFVEGRLEQDVQALPFSLTVRLKIFDPANQESLGEKQ